MTLRDKILVFIVVFIWGFNFVVIKFGLQSFPPLLFSALRFLVAALPAVFFVKFPRKSGWRAIISVGLVLGVVKFSLLFVAVSVGASAGMAALIIQTQIFFSIFLAYAFLGESISLRQYSGLAIAAVGLFALASFESEGLTAISFTLLLGAGLAWAVSNLIFKRIPKDEVFPLTIWMSIIPIVPLFAMSLIFEGRSVVFDAILNINMYGLSAIIYTGILATVFCYAAWATLLSRYSMAQVTPFAFLVPVVGLFASMVFMAESLSVVKAFALGAIMLAAAMCSMTDANATRLQSMIFKFCTLFRTKKNGSSPVL